MVDNIQSANIQAQTQRVQEMGARHAASLYGAAASGKADELQSKSEAAEPEEKVDLTGKKDEAQQGAETRAQTGADNVETFTESASDQQSSQQVAERGAELTDDSMKAAEVMVKQQIKETPPEQLSKTQPLAEPKLLELKLADSVSVADISDSMSGKPLPPVLDDPYCTHTDLPQEEIDRITREANEALKAQEQKDAAPTGESEEADQPQHAEAESPEMPAEENTVEKPAEEVAEEKPAE